MEALISVIIPIYNMEAYLARCLDSVLNNTYRNLEVLCVDDGSTDSSAEILRAYAEKDSRIVPIFKENGGVSSARNAGLDRMTGEYVTFVDPDDYVHPQYVELLYRALRESGTEIAICGFRTVGPDEAAPSDPIAFCPENLERLSVSAVFRDHSYRSYCWGKLIPAILTARVRFREDVHYVEDAIFLAELYERSDPLTTAYAPYPLYDYFQREDSVTKTVKAPLRMQAIRVLSEKLLAPDGRDDIYLDHVLKRALSNRFLLMHIYPDREAAGECGGILRKCRDRVRNTEIYSAKTKIVMLLMVNFPGLYWLFRIKREPFVLKWERAERKKRREAKKKVQ
ncbi:MAG: glycosyltransferase family 2 protein [Oscillospiraceae bacterium]|nr:glycosyltransferase family 2 protein [Oscillospiraceae bacterium]